MRITRPVALRWIALVFAGAPLGAACSNSGRGFTTEETASYTPLVPPVPCPCIGTTDAGAPILLLDGAPDGCIPDAGVLCPMPTSGTGQ